jgi:hypothetical protein
VTPKDEIQNAYGAAFVAPSGSPVAGDVLLYFALERGTVSGTSNAGFWLFKQPTDCDPTTGTFVNQNTGQPAGHSDADILLFASFTGGGTTASVSEFLWSAACTTTGQADCISTSPTGGLTTANATGVDCALSTTNLCGAFNGTSSITTPWAPGSVGTNGFFEVGMDLTKLIPANELATTCFSSFLADTRASPSVTADLHDFISGNFSLGVMGGFPAVAVVLPCHRHDNDRRLSLTRSDDIGAALRSCDGRLFVDRFRRPVIR